ncbi:MAG TPA: type I-E CRISPR-associated protein Cas6/Cse3/CasE [Pseudonocardiaceae bacterium]|nr:type I-E CRISPR-associated protein Cas6/Cse3/CasE [Pseudonocardiaceae bacterium]
MYLTRFEINTERRGARALLSSAHKLHGAVEHCFPTTAEAAESVGRVLWRLDQDHKTALLYLVSPGRPDLTHLVEQAGWPAIQQGWTTRDYTPLLDRLATGQRWAFRLTANPVSSRRKTDDSTRTQRFGHVTVAQQTAWLLDRTERLGFVVPKGTNDELDVVVCRRETLRFDRNGHTVTLATAMFQGLLDIIDPVALRHTLVQGVGSGKSYGCGLLTLAPVG